MVVKSILKLKQTKVLWISEFNVTRNCLKAIKAFSIKANPFVTQDIFL